MTKKNTDGQESMGRATLTNLERANLQRALKNLPSPYENYDEFLLEAYSLIIQNTPRRILRDILAFSRYPSSPGLIQISNLPLEEGLPPTPLNGRPIKTKQSFLSEGLTAGFSQLLGETVGFNSEKMGDLIHNVVPMRNGAHSQSNQGSEVFLNFHNEFVYDDSRNYVAASPDFLTLHCLRQDQEKEAVTYFVDARTICNGLTYIEKKTLRMPVFEMASPSTFSRSNNGGKIWSLPCPVLTGPDPFPQIALSANGVRGLNDDARIALHRLREVCKNSTNHKKIRLSPGTLLLINNRKSLHARGVFRPTYGPKERWLQRCYIRKSMWDLRHRSSEQNRVFV